MSVIVSDEIMFNEVWRSVTDAQVGIIAIYGMGGIGKTTLLKLINNKLYSTPRPIDFDIAIWITVSSDFVIGNVQDEIWRSLGFSLDQKWVEKSIHEKAKCIHDVLSVKKHVLFLDDISGPIELKSLGVPHPGIRKESKVIFTTRSLHVCHRMMANFILEVSFLPPDSAWELFRKKVGEDILSSDSKIYNLAWRISEICEGWPILLSTVSRAMACRKTYEEWKLASQKLRKSVSNVGKRVSPLLKFCFDSLPNDRIRSCFLYFGLFPEDFTIHKNDLIDLWISEEFFGYYGTGETALSLGHNIIDALIQASLLEEENDSVKMLDMIRDFALSIVLKSKMLKNAQLIEATDAERLKGVGRILAMEKSILNIPNIPPDLLTFLLNSNPLIMIRGDFYQFMEALTVLDLSNSCIEEVPQGISKLVSLQHLNLSHTWIEQLPLELKMLVRLKCLNLEYDDQLRMISRQVISSLLSLQVLRMFRCGFSMQEEEDNIISAVNMDIGELQLLEHLKVLSITMTCASALKKFISTDRLPSCTQALSLEVFWGSKSLDISRLAAMEHLVTLEIHYAEHLQQLKVDFKTERSFNSLREVSVGKCSSLQDLTWLILAPNLQVLRVASCGQMEEIISIGKLGEIQNADKSPFAKLEVLELESLPKLKSIYWEALPFQYLKKMQVLDCQLLKKLPLNSVSAEGNGLIIEGEEDWWEQVEWEDYAFLSCFRQRVD